MMKLFAFAVLISCLWGAEAKSLVVTTTDVSTTSQHDGDTQETNKTVAKPVMKYFHVESDIKYRFAHTLVSTKIANPAEVAQEVSFSAVLPDTAYISGFVMEVDGKAYKAYVKEKEEAKQVYDQAVQHGQTAAHVSLTARDANRFTVSVNVEPRKKVTFNLTYEELLSRKLGTYKDIINLDPGQIVDDFSVIVRIQESSNITTLKVPALRVSNEIKEDSESDSTNPLAKIEHPTPQTATVTFAPNADQQRELATDGLKGQLIVEYDVDRTSHPGEVLVNDGYFVHFFSPSDLKPLRKQVTFVLDVSGSMSGRKIEQLRQAMTTILDDLNKDDLFSIVLFSQTAQVWDPSLNETEMEGRIRDLDNYYTPPEYQTPKPTPSVIVKADKEGISKAKDFVSKLNALSATAIYDGLMMALDISRLETDESKSSTAEGEKTEDQKPEPIIIFLTDGQPNVKVYDTNTIVKDVTKFNTKNSSIFSLALGNDADIDFLKKLSLRNSGFARKIYEAADTALQLRDFYREVASPLLANVTFAYSPEQVEEDTLTKYNFRRLFSGSELVVAGKLHKDKDFKGNVGGSSVSGVKRFDFMPIIIIDDLPFIPEPSPEIPTNHSPSSMERMWAYLTIQQLLEEDKAKDYNHEDKNQTSAEKQKALELALKYSFVTPLTSLVVVKPNETKPVDTEDASKSTPFYPPLAGAGFAGGFAPPQMSGAAGAPAYPAGGFGSSFAAYPAVPAPANPCNPPPLNGPCGPAYKPIPQPVESIAAEEEFLHTEVYVENTTPFIPTSAPVKLLTIEDLKWLPEVTDNSTNTITLQTTGNATAEILKLASANETNIEYSPCATPDGGDGHCRHLRFCVLDVFASNKEDFLPYLCHINEYVGACCPY